MEVAPQEQSIGECVGVGASVWLEMGGFENFGGRAATDRALGFVSLEQGSSERWLTPSGDDLSIYAAAGVVVVRGRRFGRGFICKFAFGGAEQRLLGGVTPRCRNPIETFEEEVPIPPSDRDCKT